MATSWTLMLSWAKLRSSSGSLIFKKRGRSSTSQLMSRRCNKQVCTHDRAGSRALESRIGVRRLDHWIHTESLLRYRGPTSHWDYWSSVLPQPAWAPTDDRNVSHSLPTSAQCLTTERNTWRKDEKMTSFTCFLVKIVKLIRAARYGCTAEVELISKNSIANIILNRIGRT